MRWSIDVARVGGITVRLHTTFILLLIWIGVSHYLEGGWAAAVRGVAFIVAIFGSVLLHEFGHAFAARRYGIATPDITLLPIGGVARLERLPERPMEEFVVAVSGPLVNVAIAAVLFLGMFVTGHSALLQQFDLIGGEFFSQLLFINIWLVVFNLIPAFPMDGGRILRSLLATRMGFARATNVAASIGQVFAFLFVFIGFFSNPMLIFIGLFVYMGAAGEASSAQLREFAQSVPVASMMLTDVRALYEETPLGDAVEALLRGTQREFPIVDRDARVVGMLCREDVIKALHGHGPHVPVYRVMQSDLPVLDRTEMLHRVFPRMQAGNHTALAVVDPEGVLVGLLTRDNLAEVMMVESAIKASSGIGWNTDNGGDPR